MLPAEIRRPVRAIIALAALPLLAGFALGASFHGFGHLSAEFPISQITGISGDGQTIVGHSANDPSHAANDVVGSLARWSLSGGLENLDVPVLGAAEAPYRGSVVSFDGAFIAGTSFPTFQSFRRSSATGFVRPITDGFLTGAISDSGQLLAAQRLGDSTIPTRAGRYRASNSFAFEDLGFGPSHLSSFATAMTGSGSIIMGHVERVGGIDVYRWREGVGSSFMFTVNTFVSDQAVRGISDDGSVVVGATFRWTQSGGLQDLSASIEPFALTRDGRTIAGVRDNRAAIMGPDGQVRFVSDILSNDFGLNLAGWELREAVDFSADGTVLVGNGLNPAGQPEGWIAIIPEPATILLFLIAIAVRRPRRSDQAAQHGTSK